MVAKALIFLRLIAVVPVAGAFVLVGGLSNFFALLFGAIGVYAHRLAWWICRRYGVTK